MGIDGTNRANSDVDGVTLLKFAKAIKHTAAVNGKVVDDHVFPEPVTDPVAPLNIDSISLMASRLQDFIPFAIWWRSPMLMVQPLKGFSDRFNFAQF